ncbi:hypothetical protein Tco_1202420 [Tanacetum coccineum]
MEISFSYHETLKTRLARKTSLKKKVQKQYVSTQGRKFVKSFKDEPSVHKDLAFDDLDDIVDDTMDYMMSKDGSDEGDTKVSTDKQDEGTADQNEGENATQIAPTTTSTPTPTIFAEEEKKSLDEEEATKVALSNEYDFIQERLNADKILAEKLQEEEREIHVGGKKHSDLKTKGFDEIQVLYEKIKRSDDSFIAIGSTEDEKMIKEMNEQAADASKKRVKKDDNVKG